MHEQKAYPMLRNSPNPIKAPSSSRALSVWLALSMVSLLVNFTMQWRGQRPVNFVSEAAHISWALPRMSVLLAGVGLELALKKPAISPKETPNIA